MRDGTSKDWRSRRSLPVSALALVLFALLLGSAPAGAAYPGDNGKIAFSRGENIYSVDGDGSHLALLHDHAGLADNPVWAPVNGSKIAFCRFPGVFTMNSDGSDVNQVANSSCNFAGGKPTWSDDGSKLAFVGACGTSGGSDTEICLVNADGSGLTAVTDNNASDHAPAWSPDGSRIAFESGGDIYTINPDGTGQSLVTDGLGSNQGPNWSPDGSRIAFYSDRDCIGCDTHDIYSINQDGTGLQRLTMTPEYDTVPAYSPDGSKIVYESCDPLNCPESAREIHVMNADGSGQAFFVLGQSPDWGVPSSPFPPPPADGKIAYATAQDFFSGNRDEIYAMYADGFRRTRLTNNDRGDTDPDWGYVSAIVYTGLGDDANREIYVTGENGGPSLNLTSNPAQDVQPSWSPGGRIAFASDRGAGSTTGIWVMNADGSSPTELTSPPDEVSDRTPAWSPDGGKIAFVSNLDGDDDVYLMNTDGSGVVNLSNTDAGVDEQMPAWSRSAAKLAYVRVDSGAQNVWTMNRDGSGQSQLTNVGGTSSPTWSPGGTKIAFAASDGDIHAINTDGTGLTNLTNTPFWSEYDPAWKWQNPPFAGYARPKSAPSAIVRLVPAFKNCDSPNSVHGAPLSAASCDPPVPSSGYITLGGAAGTAAQSLGSASMRVFCTNGAALPCAQPGDQEDVELNAQVSDVRRAIDGSDYTGELRTTFNTRITDRANTPGSGSAGTAVDVTLGFTMSCAETSTGNIGSTCAGSTTADALFPGIATEAGRAIWQLSGIEVYDGGADDDADTTGDNTLFEVQGLFTP